MYSERQDGRLRLAVEAGFVHARVSGLDAGVSLGWRASGAASTLSLMSAEPKRRWRDYRTAAGRRPIKEFVDGLSDVDAAAVVAAMKDVRETGLTAARHLRGLIYEIRADGDRQTFRILFAREGRRSQVLLALEGFSKKTQRTPPEKIWLAERRLADWRRRGEAQSQQ